MRDASAGDELAGSGENFHAFFAKKKVDERFAAVGVRRLVAQTQVLADGEKLAEANVVDRRAFVGARSDVTDQADGDGRLAAHDTLGRGGEGLHQKRFARAEIADELVG